MKVSSSFLPLILACEYTLFASSAADVDRGVSRDDLQQRNLRSIAWTHSSFPNPDLDPESCASSSKRICDPDSILAPGDIDMLNNAIDVFEKSQLIPCADRSAKTETDDTQSLLSSQLAVAIVQRMDLSAYGAYNDEEEEVAESFARNVHDSWGVGEVTQCGGTGILIFLSILDRVMYISVGDALKNVLTDHRLDTVISNMRPMLRSGKIGDALLQSIDDIEDFIKSGEPSLNERLWNNLEDFAAFIIFSLVAGGFVVNLRRHHHREREYAQVSSQLSQLDRDRAEALQGRYQCTSCPICFEPFSEDESNENEENSNSTGAQRVGSDGLPLKLLRCGHVFDETCWSEWVSSGAGNVQKCPICQQDVGAHPETPNRDDSLRLRNNGQVDDDEVRMQRFNRERNFRLMRLGVRFPRYVGQQQIQRWADTNYEGSLVRDPRFVRSNPNHFSHSRSGGTRRGVGRSFGGGFGSRGRGGRW